MMNFNETIALDVVDVHKHPRRGKKGGGVLTNDMLQMDYLDD